LRKVCFVFFLLLFSFAVCAQSDNFDRPNEELGKIEIIQKPKCEDAHFLAKVLEAVDSYFKEKPALSTIAKRKKLLKTKNIKQFENVDAASFKPEDDFLTANALIEIKINQNVENEDIVLCRQQDQIKKPIYIISYPYMDNFKSHIINLDDGKTDYKKLFFIYP